MRVFVCLALITPILNATEPALALVCVEDCVPDPQPPEPPSPECGSDCIPAGHLKVTLSGVVTDPRGVPLADALVYWTYGSVRTLASGTFTITVWYDDPVTLWAKKSLYAASSRYVANPAVAGPVEIVLPWLLNTTVSPEAFNSLPETLTFFVYTTASTINTKVVVQIQDGSTFQLAFDTSYADPGGWSRWRATWDVPLELSEGLHTYHACVVDPAAANRCHPAPSGLLSQVKSEAFALDQTPPSIAEQAPLPQVDTLERRPIISGVLADALTGVAEDFFELRLDGVVVGADRSGNEFVYRPPVDLDSGIHTVEVAAADLAGNVASLAWIFNVAELAGTAVLGRLTPATVPVDASGAATFSNAETSLQQYGLELNLALGEGRGQVKRPITFSNLVVTFRNSLGSETTVAHPPVIVDFATGFVVLAPDLTGPLQVAIPAATVVLPTVTASAPPGFVVDAGTHGTLESRDALGAEVQEEAGPVVSLTAERLFSASLHEDCGSGGSCTVEGLVTCEIGPTVSGCGGTYPSAFLIIDGTTPQQIPAFGNRDTFGNTNQQDLSSTRNKYPRPNPAPPNLSGDQGCDTAKAHCDNYLYPGRAKSDTADYAQAYWSAGNLFRAFGHEYVFEIIPVVPSAEDRDIVMFQFSDLRPGTESGRTSCLTEAGNVLEAVSGFPAVQEAKFAPTWSSALASNFSLVPAEYKPLLDRGAQEGYRVGATEIGMTVNLNLVRDGQNAIQGHYTKSVNTDLIRPPAGHDEPFTREEGVGATNRWVPVSSAGWRPVEIATGVGLQGPIVDGFAIKGGLYFRFELIEGGSCA